LILLVMKCASSEMLLSLASKIEGDAAEKMAKQRGEGGKRIDITDIVPLPMDEENEGMDNETPSTSKSNSEGRGTNSSGNSTGNAGAVVVDANAIEVVADVDVDPTTSSNVNNDGSAVKVLPDAAMSDVAIKKQRRVTALEEKEKRQKIRDESVSGFSIKNQLRSTVASFEEDTVSQVVDNVLGSKEPGLNLSSSRCRASACVFCGLTDTALGSALVRVPSKKEWNEFVAHMSRSRNIFLVADMGPWRSKNTEGSSGRGPKQKDIVAVSIRIGGELYSDKDPSFFDGVPDGGMMEFVPRNEEGFRNEIKFRSESSLPFITGSLSAHDCCAVAAHNARKEQIVQEFKDRRAALLEKDAGSTCGRTLSLGNDRFGRSYWKLKGDSSLFVYEDNESRHWRRYMERDVIASVMHFLERDQVVNELVRVFPDSAQLYHNRKWRELLLMRAGSLDKMHNNQEDNRVNNDDDGVGEEEVRRWWTRY